MKNTRQTLAQITTLVAAVALTGCAGSPPTDLGYNNGQLLDCPSSPNCVSSSAASDDHRISPLPSQGSVTATKQKLLEVLSAQGATIIIDKEQYVRSEFTSSIMGFVDDVEFYIEENGIAVRSASRLGYSDLGANRKRVDAIRAAMQ